MLPSFLKLSFDKIKVLLVVGLGIMFSGFVAFNPTVQNYFKSKKITEREVLSTLSAYLLNNKEFFKIIKVKTLTGINLEIYKRKVDNEFEFLSSINLEDNNDGFIQYQDHSTNLAINDIDGDRQLEIIAPTFDPSLTAHLNIIKYNTNNQMFYLVQEPLFSSNN